MDLKQQKWLHGGSNSRHRRNTGANFQLTEQNGPKWIAHKDIFRVAC